ncbi:MAG: hypothetical protein PF569_02460 [Candidatus Woesearchaeota archaeon]|jgi:hypothetical protein|nr:hypothetical protein [Candidatus Woesearchaeota archaeon]
MIVYVVTDAEFGETYGIYKSMKGLINFFIPKKVREEHYDEYGVIKESSRFFNMDFNDLKEWAQTHHFIINRKILEE